MMKSKCAINIIDKLIIDESQTVSSKELVAKEIRNLCYVNLLRSCAQALLSVDKKVVKQGKTLINSRGGR